MLAAGGSRSLKHCPAGNGNTATPSQRTGRTEHSAAESHGGGAGSGSWDGPGAAPGGSDGSLGMVVTARDRHRARDQETTAQPSSVRRKAKKGLDSGRARAPPGRMDGPGKQGAQAWA